MSICNPINIQTAGIYTAGDKYECDVDPNKEGYDYIFYVLNSTATEVNLIMDSNINISGEAVKSDDIDDKGFVAWYADGYDSSYGPITAMNHLQTATAGWTNTNELTINTFTECPYNTGTCTNKPMTEYIVNARMPFASEVSDYNKEANNAYLYDNLSLMCWDELEGQEVSCSDPSVDDVLGLDVEGLEHVRDVYGYWLLSSLGDSGPSVYSVWFVHNSGYVGNRRANEDVIDAYNDGGAGVRPVINLSI